MWCGGRMVVGGSEGGDEVAAIPGFIQQEAAVAFA